ncbi:hypothetical protein [Marinomonas sp.]
MDSQQQYEALLEKWGYLDNSLAAKRRREARALRMQKLNTLAKQTYSFLSKAFKKATARPQTLKQAA